METKIDFIGIGTAKSATTLIASLLGQHPDVCLSIPQKILYFNKENTFWFKDKVNWKFDEPVSWYLNHFKHCSVNSTKGEFASIYFSDPMAPEKIHTLFPDVKLIACFRDPVDRAYSHYNMVKNYHLFENRTFREALEKEPEYVERGLYFKYLSRYLEYFKRDQIHVIFFEDVKSHPKESMKKLFEFLGVDSSVEVSPGVAKANKPKKTRFKFMKNFEFYITRMIGAMGLGIILKYLKSKGFDRFFHRLYIKSYTYEAIDEESRNWAKSLFRDDINQLEQLLQVDLSHWK